jgi:hypothetical protein
MLWWSVGVWIVLCVSALWAPAGHFMDWVACGAIALLVAHGVGWLVWGSVSEWWAIHGPNPVAPEKKPRYWPGSTMDKAQKGAEAEVRSVGGDV